MLTHSVANVQRGLRHSWQCRKSCPSSRDPLAQRGRWSGLVRGMLFCARYQSGSVPLEDTQTVLTSGDPAGITAGVPMRTFALPYCVVEVVLSFHTDVPELYLAWCSAVSCLRSLLIVPIVVP